MPLLFNLYGWSWNGPGSSMFLSKCPMASPNSSGLGLIGMSKDQEKLSKMKIEDWPQPAYVLNMLFLPDGA